MTNKMKNIIALNDFSESLLNKTEYGNDGYCFESLVTYEASNKTVTEILDIYLIIGGFEPMIKMDTYCLGKIITSEKYHLDLNPRFDNITFKYLNNKLIVDGSNSPKIGNYKITFEENN